MIKNLKSVSSRRIRQEYSEHLKQYFWSVQAPSDFKSRPDTACSNAARILHPGKQQAPLEPAPCSHVRLEQADTVTRRNKAGRQQLLHRPYFWNRAYCIISVGGRANIQTLLKYIENQDEPGRLGVPHPTD